MTLHQLGLDTDDYVHYIRGTLEDERKIKLIEDHWSDDDFPYKNK